MVSIQATSKKYRGRKAATYDAVRQKQRRWRLENEIVERMLRELRPKTVLDVPVGTGRFLELYNSLNVEIVTGIDSSDAMLSQAALRKSSRRMVRLLLVGDAAALEDTPKHEVSVCVRFLDLIDEDAMRRVVRELCRVTRRAIICTIRYGDKYVPKVNTAEHDRSKFRALVRRCGFEIHEEVPIFEAGWHVVQMRRK